MQLTPATWSAVLWRLAGAGGLLLGCTSPKPLDGGGGENQLPQVGLTAPTAGASIPLRVARSVTAQASDPDGEVARVEFFDGASLIGEASSTPFSVSWTPQIDGDHQLTARAVDDDGGAATSSAVSITVVNAPPTVTLGSAPPSGNVLIGANVALTATAADPDGLIEEVRFYDGATLISVDATAPHQASWIAAGAGVHGLTARAVDDLGLETTSAVVSFTVSAAPNTRPTAVIAQPTAGLTYRAGDTIEFSGSATDPEDGTLGAGSLSWWAVFHHDSHTHPFVPVAQGGSGLAVIPDTGETAATVWYRFYLSAIDAQGAADTVFRDVLPQTASITIASDRSGLQVTLDGQPHTAPYSVTSVVGMSRTLGVVTPQTLGDSTYTFTGWSDGGAANHGIATPASNTTYTASFTATGPANQAPTVSLTAPAAGAELVIAVPVTLTADASDADGTVSQVQFFDGPDPIGAPDVSLPYGVSWTPASLGAHSLTARATDDDQASTTSAAVSVNVINTGGGDVIAPTAQLTGPTDGTTNLTGPVPVTASASDNVGVTQVDFELDGESIGSDNSDPYQVTLPATSPFTTGVHVFRARARDAAGNQSPWSAVRVTFGGNVNMPAGFSRSVFVQNLGGLATAMTFLPDGRLLICEQAGALRVVKNGALLTQPAVTVTTMADGERGLLGVTHDPQFNSNQFIYVYYTAQTPAPHNRISRYTLSGDIVVPGSESVVRDLPTIGGATNHNGGAIHFGPDGKLYVAVGERAMPNNAQDLGQPFGKVLRLNSDGSFPSDNPFFNTAGAYQGVWAYGLRNPFTFGFSSTGRLFINDVGQNNWEEINEGVAGSNYGWPTSEGATTNPAFRGPVYTYGHDGTPNNPSLVTGIAIVGGPFYEPATLMFGAAYAGNYFFGDYGNGWINRLDLANGNAAYAFARSGTLLTDMRVGSDGALYVLADVGATWGVYRYSRP